MSEADKIEWLTIKQNSNYEISNNGQVRNKNTKRILKPAISNKGYYLVGLSNKCKMHTYTIHKLVMEHFNRCAFDGEVINHIDGNKLNNNINNLEYVTQKVNTIKAWEMGLCEKTRQALFNRKQKSNIRTSKRVVQFDMNGNIIGKFESIRQAERATGIPDSNIMRCCRKIQPQTRGYRFEFESDYNARTKSNK